MKRPLVPLVVALALVLAGAAVAGPLPGTRTAHDRAAWRSILHWPGACESGWKATRTPGAGIEVFPAGSAGRLLAVECYPGAYQSDAMLYFVPPAGRPAGPLTLQVYIDPGNGRLRLERATTILGVLSFTAATGSLTVFDEFRGLGDCGIYSTYRLSGGTLKLVTARAKTACKAKPPFSPERWPKLT